MQQDHERFGRLCAIRSRRLRRVSDIQFIRAPEPLLLLLAGQKRPIGVRGGLSSARPNAANALTHEDMRLMNITSSFNKPLVTETDDAAKQRWAG